MIIVGKYSVCVSRTSIICTFVIKYDSMQLLSIVLVAFDKIYFQTLVN